VTRTGVRRRLAVTLAVVAVAAAWGPALGRAIGRDDAEPVARSRYVVQPGDTVWSIAVEIAPSEDPRPLVDAISSANAIDAGALAPGQTIVIPAG
jgi:Tfp pilus assembly protein FimV